MSDDELVKVRLLFREGEDLPHSETMWARPVDATDAGGTYALENSSFMVPLAAGDVVRADLDGDGGLQVTDVVQPGAGILTVVEAASELGPDAAQAMVAGWTAAGAVWTEGHHALQVTVWRDGLSVEEIGAALRDDVRTGRAEWVATALPEERTRPQDVDFELQRQPAQPPVSTTYWVGDDPWWAEHGFDDPDYLAFVQSLAGKDPRVARALENGKQHQVVQFVERITSDDPASLPPLDGPIFDD